MASGQRDRVRFPLWAKLGLAFGGLAGAYLAFSGWNSFQADLALERQRQETRLRGLAQTLAEAIDGDAHQRFLKSDSMRSEEWKEMQRLLNTAKTRLDLAWVGTSAQDAGGRFHFVVDGGYPPPLPVGYPIFDGAEARNQAIKGDVIYVEGLEDEVGLWTVAFAPIRNSAGHPVGLVEVMSDTDAAQLSALERTRATVLDIAWIFFLCMVVAVWLGRYLSHNLLQLTDFALGVASKGDFERRNHIDTWDEIGVLARAFNAMLAGLAERERIRETFGRFVSREVVHEVLSGQTGLKLGGEARVVTVLMSDLRGFTAMAERLGAEATVPLLNRYFTRMTHEIMEHKGIVSELQGDGIVALFGAPQSYKDDPLRAVATAVAMQRALVDFVRVEGHDLEMGIGINTGPVIAGNIGSEQRMKYGVVGTTINLAGRIENYTVGSQVLISQSTYDAVRPFVEVGPPIAFQAKGRAELLQCYPVLRVGPPYDLTMPTPSEEGDGISMDVPLVIFPVLGKTVEQKSVTGRLVRLRRSTVDIVADWPTRVSSNYKLSFELNGVAIDDYYVRVAAIDGTLLHMRLTSVTDEARAVMDALLKKA